MNWAEITDSEGYPGNPDTFMAAHDWYLDHDDPETAPIYKLHGEFWQWVKELRLKPVGKSVWVCEGFEGASSEMKAACVPREVFNHLPTDHFGDSPFHAIELDSYLDYTTPEQAWQALMQAWLAWRNN